MPTAAANTVTLHGTTISRDGRAAMVIGPSGSGKSDLALRCITGPFEMTLVSDDQTIVTRSDGDLIVTAPVAIAGKLEVRGLGIVDAPRAPLSQLVLIVRLRPISDAIPRLPDAVEYLDILGLKRPVLELHPFEASAPNKIWLALDPRNGWVAP